MAMPLGAQGSIEADGFPKEDYSIWWNECNHPSDHTKYCIHDLLC